MPNIGIAVSGGGYRAMMTGAGVLAAFDDRTAGTVAPGGLGGLLQSATSVMDSMQSSRIWRFETNLLGLTQTGRGLAFDLIQSTPTINQRITKIIAAVFQKQLSGFVTSAADFWARALSYQFIDLPEGGPSETFSSLTERPFFARGDVPLPLIVADGAVKGATPLPINTTVYEFSPWELGSYDDSLDGFAPLRYVGSRFESGFVPGGEFCVTGMDNTGFVFGTSSFLFNLVLQEINNPNSKILAKLRISVDPFIRTLLNPLINKAIALLNRLGGVEGAFWAPNPFKNWNQARNPISAEERLTLVDGGEDSQNIPLQPHLLRDRNVDVVFAVDSSADTDHSWPDGSAMVATFRRSLFLRSKKMSFPPVPGRNSFINLGLNTKPTFFGCNAANLTPPSPLVVYLPNYPYVTYSNISTFSLSTERNKRDEMINNGFAVATQLNGIRDPEWPVCVGCAILARSFDRTRTPMPESCRRCFSRYCWNGQVDESKPAPYLPTIYAAGSRPATS
ncbi:hypothetical protein CDD80_2987 [Ophiocordyceps camponoti-rufipedis]|uniref:Lysophospholipase n=1 Tax=Ophiocordyceps camponoti-rufipedis TaxID=2004952 RepID=A0A2C5Z0S4_9HYPO|nr:hypothetical protein CDD80_2987 [Ophiocordyceps camponoti-rufipedis]